MDTHSAWILIGKSVLLFALPVLGYIFYNVKRGKFTNMDVSDRKQRNNLYYFIMALLGIYVVITKIQGEEVPHPFYVLILLLIAMMISNFWIKSSMHTALNFYVAALFYQLNPTYGIIWAILTFVVAITRLILKRHTPAEVISGGLLGIIAGLALIIWK